MRKLFVVAVLFCFALHSPTQAQTSDGTALAGEGSDPTVESTEKAAPHTIDLGDFRLNELRPASNEVAKLTFKMHLVVSPSMTKKQTRQLEKWQHRLRDQVHIAIRTMEIKDFQEPSLNLLRRKILLRVNRLFQAKVIDEVLLTEYLFRTH